MNSNYRKEIDGLRAIAVFSVVFFHAGFSFFAGGFIGVDVFFVISGYLITNIILKEIINNKFSIKKFYERRARRILPALFLVMIISIPLAIIFLTRAELSSFFKSLVATSIFLSNMYFWREAPYFHAEAEFKPLLHTWSLSIEEQFYILFPIILILLWKLKKELIIFFLILVFISSLLLAEWASKTYPNANFYFIFTRAWELAIGSIIAYYNIYAKNINFSTISNEFFSFFGLAAILISIFFYSEQSFFPSFQALVPTLGTALIIFFANKKTLIGKILSNKLLVGVGLISYSFYLWHQPLFAFAKAYNVNINLTNKMIIILLSLVLSFFSWRFIEKIFRDKNIISSKKIFLLSSFLIIFFVTFGLSTYKYFDSKSIGGSEAKLAKLLSKNSSVYSTSMDERNFVKYRIIYDDYSPQTLVIGSSTILQISNEISEDKVLNLGVSGASVEDHIAITEMALEKYDPEVILLGSDPWLFNYFNYQNRWRSLKTEYEQSLLNIKNKNKKFLRIDTSLQKDLSAKDTVLENLYGLMNINKQTEIPNKLNGYSRGVKLRDGSIVHTEKEIEKNFTNSRAVNYSMNKYLFANEKLELYDSFLEHLLKVHKKKVVLILPPFRPKNYEITIKERKIFLEVEELFIKLAKKHSIKIIGSYNPKKNGCKNEEFFDDIHPEKSCLAKVLSELN